MSNVYDSSDEDGVVEWPPKPRGSPASSGLTGFDNPAKAMPRIFAAQRSSFDPVKAPSLEGLSVEVPDFDAPAEEELSDLFEDLIAERSPRTQRKAGEKLQADDRVVADVIAYVDGQLVPHLTQPRSEFFVAPEAISPALVKALLGATVGQSLRFQTRLEEDHALEPLRGRDVTYAIHIREAESIDLPEGEWDAPETLTALGLNPDVDVLLEAIAVEALEEREGAVMLDVLDQIYDQLLERTPVHVTEAQIDSVSGALWMDAQGRFLQQMNIDPKDREAAAKLWLDDPDTRAETRRHLQITLLVNAIAEANNIQVDLNTDVPEYLSTLADTLGFDAEELLAEMKADPKASWAAAQSLRHLATLELMMTAAEDTEGEDLPD